MNDLLKREFPDFDPATLPPIPKGFTCSAWHNDACPIWLEGEPTDALRAGMMQLGIDYADPALREIAETRRFFLNVLDLNGNVFFVTSSDDFGDIEIAISFVRHVRDLGLGFHPDTRGRDYIGPGDFGRYFTDEQADEYDATMRDFPGDAYEASVQIWTALGLVTP
jgi:hypothetical protein